LTADILVHKTIKGKGMWIYIAPYCSTSHSRWSCMDHTCKLHLKSVHQTAAPFIVVADI